MLKIVRIKPKLGAFKHLFDHGCISADGDTLVSVIKVVVVKGESHRKTLDDKCGKFLAVAPPLFFGILFYELLIYIASHKAECLLLQVFGFAGEVLCLYLFLYLSGSFSRSGYAPEL